MQLKSQLWKNDKHCTSNLTMKKWLNIVCTNMPVLTKKEKNENTNDDIRKWKPQNVLTHKQHSESET